MHVRVFLEGLRESVAGPQPTVQRGGGLWVLLTRPFWGSPLPPNLIPVIKEIRFVAGLGLKEAKILAERGGQVGGPMDEEQANLVKSRLELLGAKVSLQ
ncbi:MAG TPA: hypothetical protein DDX54_03315 [Rhodospirillaceae bacterium]|jgi:hypothetical protein|nr:ribosomal protein L7/L12 [Alphaproteobacteria bacterium]HBH26414.1 hypothetical protein [Rhodospirillaceae bacterium]